MENKRRVKFIIALCALVFSMGPLSALQVFADDREDMVLIPAGEFQMGGAGKYDGKPIHTVYVDAFYIDEYEVTQKDFERAMNSNPSRFKGDNRPVEKVTWDEARQYCEQLDKRLPTEAEWEYAAKGGPKGELGGFWYKGNSEKRSHAVGRVKPNSFGLFDMLGNVWEWVADWHDNDYYKTSPHKNPMGPLRGDNKVLRGGSWGGAPLTVRPTFRLNLQPSSRNHAVGFRCAASGVTRKMILFRP